MQNVLVIYAYISSSTGYALAGVSPNCSLTFFGSTRANPLMSPARPRWHCSESQWHLRNDSCLRAHFLARYLNMNDGKHSTLNCYCMFFSTWNSTLSIRQQHMLLVSVLMAFPLRMNILQMQPGTVPLGMRQMAQRGI